MKKKTIIVIAIVCLIIAGVITAVIIRNNAVKESAGEEKAGNEDLANDDSMNKFGEAEVETFVVAEDGSVLSTVDDKYYTFEQAEAPSDMFPNGQTDYEVRSGKNIRSIGRTLVFMVPMVQPMHLQLVEQDIMRTT